MSNLQQLSEIITKWKLNQTLLAEKLGMSRANFCRKLNPDQAVKFSGQELDQLREALIELRTDLGEIDELDFNEALRIVSQKEV